MANKVFANSREISCKSGSGKSIAASPDVCFTPPENPATPPGVPTPYPNTGMASDTSDGSKSVMISGCEVMLRDKSFFKKSTGDEAGCAAKKGVISSTNRGKVYFISWSTDVKIEGENVVRHLDLTTHNHASPPGNSPPTAHQDSMSPSSGDAGECDHEWEEQKPKISYTAEQKKERLRKTGIPGDAFEAAAADHNKIKNGDDMSGENAASKLNFRCKKCGKINEVDHVIRDENGRVTEIVECKSGGAGIKGKQALARLDMAKKLGCKAKYKLQSGEGAEEAKKFLLGKGWSADSIVCV